MGAVALGMIALLVFLTTRVGTADLSMLYGNLSPQDSAQIVQNLQSRGVIYESRNNGQEIWVPTDQVQVERLTLGQQGLPASGTVSGYETIFGEDGSLTGSTAEREKLKQKVALEGELARTVMSMATIQNARVHLVLPEREIFSREQRDPSASVTVKVRGRAKLKNEQVMAIQQVVAAAVPGLQPTRISVVDDQGRVYSRGVDDIDGLLATKAEEQRRAYESELVLKIEDLVGRVVGPDNVRVSVTAEMDFNREQINKETYDPDLAVPRSVQEVTEVSEATETQGEDPVTVAQNLPDADTAITTAAGRFERTERTEETRNFEISREFTTSIRETGKIKRLAVSVVVDGSYRSIQDPETNKLIEEYVPRTQNEIDQIYDMVKSAMAYDPDRDDEIKVVNMQFFRVPFEEELAGTILGMPEEDFYTILRILALIMVALLVILVVVRPLIQRALEATQESEDGVPGTPGLPERPGAPALGGPDLARLDETAEMEALEQMIDINQVEGRVRASSLRKIGEIVDKHPEEAVAILRNWMYQEA